jgi:Leucine-rich repeat (LRR) protein
MGWNSVTWRRTGAVGAVFVTCVLVGALQADEIALRKPNSPGGVPSILHFPYNQCVGNLYVEPESIPGWAPDRVCLQYNWEYAGMARGDAAVPQDRNVQLIVRLGLRPGDSTKLLAQNRLAYQMQVADRTRVDPDDLAWLSRLDPNDLCWLVVSSLIRRTDADERILEPMRHLTGLRILSLNNTGVTDKGMEHLKALRSLRALELSGELSIGNVGLAVLKDLPALEYLDLDTGATDAGFKDIGQLASLRWLRIRTGRIWGPGLAELVHLPRLERLCIWGSSEISDRHIQYLEGLTQLKSLTLWGAGVSRLTDSSLVSIGKLRNLEELHFLRTSPQFTPAGVARLKDLKNLKIVDFAQAWSGLEGMRYGDEVARQLAALSGLESIKGVSYLSAEGVKAFATFRNLRCLDIGLKDRRQGYHGPTGLSHLKGLDSLEELSITGKEAWSAADLTCLESLRGVKALSIMGPQVTDQGLASINKLEQLERLDLAGTPVTRSGLSQLTGLKNLRDLNVEMWPESRLGNAAGELTLDLSTLGSLERLRLSGLLLREADVASVANLRHLEEVTIDASVLPGRSLRYLTGLSELNYLSVTGLSPCTAEDLAQLSRLPQLRSLTLGGEITDASLTSLGAPPNLQSLRVMTRAPIREQTIADLKPRLPVTEYIHIDEPLPSPQLQTPAKRSPGNPSRGSRPAPQSSRRAR